MLAFVTDVEAAATATRARTKQLSGMVGSAGDAAGVPVITSIVAVFVDGCPEAKSWSLMRATIRSRRPLVGSEAEMTTFVELWASTKYTDPVLPPSVPLTAQAPAATSTLMLGVPDFSVTFNEVEEVRMTPARAPWEKRCHCLKRSAVCPALVRWP